MRYRRLGSRHLGLGGATVGEIVWSRTTSLSLGPVAWQPPADVRETADAISVAVELAGMDEDAIDISLYPDALVIAGVRPPVDCAPDTIFHRAEIRPGPFQLVLTLPQPVDADAVTASYDRGLLTVELPKATDGGEER